MHVYHLLPFVDDDGDAVKVEESIRYPIAYFTERLGADIAAERWLTCNRAFHPRVWHAVTTTRQARGYCVVIIEDGDPIGVLGYEVVADAERYAEILAAGRK